MKENVMGGASSTYGREEKCTLNFNALQYRTTQSVS